jgi:hypothetical protein
MYADYITFAPTYMEKSASAKLFMIFLPSFILALLGMIWYNANFIQKTDKEYSQLIESTSLSSNALTQTNINTSFAMHLCYKMVLDGNNDHWIGFANQLDSIKKENSNLIKDLELDAKTIEQKQKLAELMGTRANLIIQRDSLVKLVKQNLTMQAKDFLQSQMADSFNQFFKTSSSYLLLAQENSTILSQKLSAKNETVKKINQYLFWLPIACFGLFALFIIFIFFRIYHFTKDDLDY